MTTLQELEGRLKAIEARFGSMNYDMRGVVQSELKSRMVVNQQSESQFGCYTALCVETIDIWKQNRIRFYCPLFHNPKRPIKELPWAYPCSALGGFDDCGLTWVPPAGSTVIIMFENGSRASPFYFGSTWHRNRGPKGENNWGIGIQEYKDVWEGHRGGYLVGPDDESQVLPPWNTENYNGFDLSSIVDFADNPEAQRRITYPHIYGLKTPEKHMIKMVDGDPKCNRRWKRFEIMSSCGNWFMMKDDHLHYAGQWSHPSCGADQGDTSCVVGQGAGTAAEDITRFQGLSVDSSFNSAQTSDTVAETGAKSEDSPCNGTQSNSKIIGGHPRTGHPNSKYAGSQVGTNPYFKHKSECRPYKGAGTPQDNRVDLPQTGIQFMSISGHTFVMDDSVEEPSGNPEWERGTEDFDFGCNNHYVGRCVAASEFITLSNGSRVLAGMLCGKKFFLPDIDEKGNFRTVAAMAEPNAVEVVYKLKLDNGHVIVRNGEHPLWTMSRDKISCRQNLKQRKGKILGWTKCEDIQTGNYIAIAESLPFFGENTITPKEAKILGYLIGDGGFTGVNVKFSQQDNEQLKELTALVEELDCQVKKLNAYDYHITSNGNKNAVISLLKKHNLMGCHSRNKRVPDALFTCDLQIISVFLNRLFSTDGWATQSANGCAQIGFASISERLVRDVQHLCCKLGIHGKTRLVRKKPSKLISKASSVWVFEILRKKDLINFADRVGIFGKEKAVEAVVSISKSRKHTRTWIQDQLPQTLRWAKVVSVEILEPNLTIAIQVPNTHTFLTEVWEHNTYWKSATGHMIEMSDVESQPGDQDAQLRGEDNYIRLKTASGIKVELNDHTISQKNCPGCPPNVAGEKRGVTIQTTSNHKFEMIDDGNEQCSPCRKEGGEAQAKANKAFIRIRSGYGLEISMKDENSQQETVQQTIQIFCPQKDNTVRGPHIMRFQESPSGPGMIFLRAGGTYIASIYDDMIEVVGDEELNPADKMEIISRKKMVVTRDNYINYTYKNQLFIAKDKIYLMAGTDCTGPSECGPCMGPVLVYVNGCIRLSDRIYGSASNTSPQASIFMLKPLVDCPPGENCTSTTNP